MLEGRHDFKAFQGTGGETHGTERVLYSACVAREETEDHHASTCPETGSSDTWSETSSVPLSRWAAAGVPPFGSAEVLAAGDRALAGRTAPAAGLFLVAVEYDRADADTGSKI